MAAFSDLTPILLDVSRPGTRNAGNWALWPVYGHRVLAPVLRDKGLNLFQRAVLEFISRAGIRQAARQAELLSLSPDLTALVQEELIDMGFIERNGALSHRGSKMLEETREDRTDDPSVCWLFTDALSGERWPRFLQVPLPTVVPVGPPGPAQDKKVRLQLGTEGHPFSPQALRWEPSGQSPAVAPTPQEILALARKQARRARQKPQLHQVSPIDDEATPFYLALRVCAGGEGFEAFDPFSGMPDSELTTWFDRLEPGTSSKHPHPLWMWLTGGRQKDQTQSLAELHTQAEHDVDRELTLAIDNHPNEKRLLVAMQRALLEARMPGAPGDKWSDVMVKTQVALENLIGLTIPGQKEQRKKLVQVIPMTDRVAAQDLFEGLARQAGFSALPRTLVSVQPGKVIAALQSRKGSLRPLILAALLGAREDSAHPLCRLAGLDPRMLDRFDRLASLRDSVAHASTGKAHPKEGERVCQKEIEDAVLLVFRAAQALLFPTRGVHERTGSHDRESPQRAPAPSGAEPARGVPGNQA